ncbi:MAG: helical backbone metal receptor [Glaciecola sp.]|jgi:vitamin B12 transport system substrate-binding protein
MKTLSSLLFSFCLLCSLLTASAYSCAQSQLHAIKNTTDETSLRIITLAPHLAEIVALLGLESSIVGVSEATNYPHSMSNLPTIANHRGVNFSKILALKPTHVIAWIGGNQTRDIQKLKELGLSIHAVKIDSLEDIATQISTVGAFLAHSDIARTHIAAFNNDLALLRKEFTTFKSKRVFYYSGQRPMFTIGKDAWVTKLLSECQLESIYAHSAIAYPEANISYVLAQQPEIVISSQKASFFSFATYWRKHESVLRPHLIQVDPDQMHRFTPRVIGALRNLCQDAHAPDQ